MEVFVLSRSGTYQQKSRSQLLPELNIALLEGCLRIDSWHKARQTFRAGLAKSR